MGDEIIGGECSSECQIMFPTDPRTRIFALAAVMGNEIICWECSSECWMMFPTDLRTRLCSCSSHRGWNHQWRVLFRMSNCASYRSSNQTLCSCSSQGGYIIGWECSSECQIVLPTDPLFRRAAFIQTLLYGGERSGSVVECSTRDRVSSSSLCCVLEQEHLS